MAVLTCNCLKPRYLGMPKDGDVSGIPKILICFDHKIRKEEEKYQQIESISSRWLFLLKIDNVRQQSILFHFGLHFEVSVSVVQTTFN